MLLSPLYPSLLPFSIESIVLNNNLIVDSPAPIPLVPNIIDFIWYPLVINPPAFFNFQNYAWNDDNNDENFINIKPWNKVYHWKMFHKKGDFKNVSYIFKY